MQGPVGGTVMGYKHVGPVLKYLSLGKVHKNALKKANIKIGPEVENPVGS